MASYSFRHRPSGADLTLAQVDESLCAHVGVPVQDEIYCYVYDPLVDLGMSYLMKNGGSSVPLFKDAVWPPVFKPGAWDNMVDQNTKDLIQWFFDEFEFSAWRGGPR